MGTARGRQTSTLTHQVRDRPEIQIRAAVLYLLEVGVTHGHLAAVSLGSGSSAIPQNIYSSRGGNRGMKLEDNANGLNLCYYMSNNDTENF